MANNDIKLKSIAQLLEMNFFIPNYQRGYRWTIQQVKDLLEDIKDFCVAPSNFYCLQPIVVRKMNDADIESQGLQSGKIWYEVIDGQQRLTSIYLILKAFCEVINIIGLPTTLYNIEFEREIGAHAKSLVDVEKITDIDSSTIDRYHVSRAMCFIKKWKKQHPVNYPDFCNALLKTLPSPEDANKDIANNVRVIWYESVDEDPISVFTRLNIGKISLTNSELIKALILNRGNFKNNKDAEFVRLRQQEIASEWDMFETSLQDDTFWLFLHEAKYDRPTRIDFIFDLMREQNTLQLPDSLLSEVGSDQYQTFRYFYAYFKDKSRADIETCWGKVKQYFQAFREWYDDSELYHYIGYLLYYSTPTLIEILNSWDCAKNKAAFRQYLMGQIKDKIKNCPSLNHQYKIDGSDKGNCRPILIFHNIQTAINMNNNISSRTIGMAYRFPFDSLKLEHWDVEHINSNTTNPEDDIETQKEWLINIYMSVPENLQKEIQEFFNGKPSEDQTRTLFEKVKKYIPQLDEWGQEEKNKIWNYTLLDSSTNRSYGNAIFSGKRRVIIGKDSGKYLGIPQLRKGVFELPETKAAKSCFVPPVTKKVFLKYYSASAGNNNYWDIKIDAQAYLDDIQACINQLNNDGKQ